MEDDLFWFWRYDVHFLQNLNDNMELHELCWIYWKCLIAEYLFVKYFITSVPDPEGRTEGQETSGEEGKKLLIQFIHSSVTYMSQTGIMRPNWDG